jgi:hypothetical protein
MNSGQQVKEDRQGIPAEPRKLTCSTRSAEVLLAFLILISIYVVTVYDWVFSRILKLIGCTRGATGTRTSFETTHLSRSVARRLRPIK